MKLKRIILPLAAITTVVPIATAVSCGSGNQNTETNGGAGADSIDLLSKQIEVLKAKLDDKKTEQGIDAQQKANVIDDLTKKISELQSKLDTLNNDLSVKNIAKELTLEDKKENFQRFASGHSNEFNQLTFDEVKLMFDPELPMARGIESFSLAQTASYLQNLAIKLGFKENLNELKDLSKATSGDAIIDADRAETYNYTKKMIDGLKAMDDAKRDEVLNRDTYTRFSTLYSIGNPLSTQRFDQSGIDTSAFGALLLKQQDNSSTSYIYPNFNFKTKSNKQIQLFSDLPWIDDNDLTSYDGPNIFGVQRIDADKPGSVITTLDFAKTINGQLDANGAGKVVELLPAFSKQIEVNGLANVYSKATGTEREHNINILEAIIRKMNVVFAPENANDIINLRKNADKNNISQRLIDALEYLGQKFESHNSGFDMKDVEAAYDKLNNGSHYFKAIEVFARGMSGVVFSTPAKGGDLYAGYVADPKASYNGIINMAFNHLEGTLLPWGTLQGNGLYTFASEKFSWTLDFRDYKPTK